jgi:hypothetical protein
MKIFILGRQFDFPVLGVRGCYEFLHVPWKKSTFRNKVSDLINLDDLKEERGELSDLRSSLGDIDIQVWLTCLEELRETRFDYLISKSSPIQRVPWNTPDLESTMFYLLDGDYRARCYLDKDPPDPDLNYANWRDSLDNVGIGIQAWLVTIKPDRTKELSIYDGMGCFSSSVWDGPEEPGFYYYLEWGWRFNSPSGIEIRACRAGAEKAGYKPLKFLVPEIMPAISYTWPSEDRRDPKAIKELETQLLSLL